MSLNEGKKNILIGGIEEHTPLFVELNRNAKKFNTDTTHPLFEGKTHGIQMGEGSAFFAVSSEKQHAKSCIDGISLLYKPKSSKEVLDKVNSFLATEDTTLDTIDLVLFGFSGDYDFDKYLLELLPLVSNNSATAHYKHLCGDYHTAGAFALWLGDKIIRKQEIPHAIRINHHTKTTIKSILIINAYLGINYSFTLLRQC